MALALAAAWSAAPAGAALRRPGPASGGVPETLLFPVVGAVSYKDDFGDARGNGPHGGNDLMADKRSPVVAVEAGRVRIYNRSSRAGCMLYLYGASGTTYLYIHLNNDLGPGNDNRGGCANGVAFAPGLADGQRVGAGELVGYVGDSGDADGIASHLHFELHPGDGAAVSPFGWLQRATTLLYAVPGTPSAGERAQSVGGLRLALHGTITAVGELDGFQALGLRIGKVRISTGARGGDVDREVVVTVPPGTPVQRQGTNGRTAAELALDLVGSRVVVWTAPFEASLETQIAAPGALAVAQVLLLAS